MLTNPPIRGPRHTLSANEGHLKIDPATVFTAPILADLRQERAGIYDPDHTQPLFCDAAVSVWFLSHDKLSVWLQDCHRKILKAW